MTKNKILISVAIVLSGTLSVNAQTEDNALDYSYNQPTGTARSMGLGGAMGALGGDYSAVGINPAGIAIYRSNEFSFTPSLIFNQMESNYNGTMAEDDKFSLPINHVSYVGTNSSMRDVENGLVSTHFGIGYNRTNNYNRKSFIQGLNINSSLLDEFVYQANENGLTPFYSDLAYDAYLLDPTSENSDNYYNAFEYLDENDEPQWGPDNGLDQSRIISESGSSGEFSMVFGANFSNKFHIGSSLGITTLRYEKEFEHYEEVAPSENQWDYLNNYSFHDNLRTTGTGINLKVGAIYKPIQEIRFGASIQTPTFYSINEEFSTRINLPSDFAADMDINKVHESDFGENEYDFRTPFKAVGSFAYVFGNKGLISVDYEYTDFGSMQFKSKNANINETSYFNNVNDVINKTFNPTHNLRFGAEYKINPSIALRGGYATFQNPYKNQLELNLEDGSQEKYDIQKNKYNISGGIGFRSNNMTVDVAYLYSTQSYINSLYYSGYVIDDFQRPVEMTSTDHHLAVSLGWRF